MVTNLHQSQSGTIHCTLADRRQLARCRDARRIDGPPAGDLDEIGHLRGCRQGRPVRTRALPAERPVTGELRGRVIRDARALVSGLACSGPARGSANGTRGAATMARRPGMGVTHVSELLDLVACGEHLGMGPVGGRPEYHPQVPVVLNQRLRADQEQTRRRWAGRSRGASRRMCLTLECQSAPYGCAYDSRSPHTWSRISTTSGACLWGNLGDGAPDGGGYHSARQIDKLDRVLVGNLPEVDAGKRRRNALCENDDPIACSTSAQPWMLAGSSLHVLTTSAESRRGTCVLVDRYALNQHQSPAGKGASSLEDDLGSARVC